ncbi:MAG: mitochondrial fission ELM1 family protein [Alphaproteobacteria bacterium]|nr:mitochondrial fission ELM1 family protein [Alphaproteobacteria bacterium]
MRVEVEPFEAARCWALSPGHAGMENQCLGLAERLGLPTRRLRLYPRAPWTWLPPGCWPAPARALAPESDTIRPPWPELVISCGRRAVPYGLLVKRLSGGRSFAVHIQDPRTRPARFDLVIAPRHDHLAGANVVETLGSLNRITQDRLAEAAARVAPELAHLPRPLVAVLIGGTSRAYRLTPEISRRLADELAGLAESQGVGLAVTPSRRTGSENVHILRQRLAPLPTAVFWNLEGENPYHGYLGLADHIVVTGDSTNLVSEAASTGKPVHVVELAGGNAKFAEFHESMRAAGYTRPFRVPLESWTYTPLDETGRMAAKVRRRLAARG